MATEIGGQKYDNLHEIDERYCLSETDVRLEYEPEYFGKRRIGVAIVGVGRMGAIHLYNVLREPRADVKYVLDASHQRLEYMNKKYYLAERGIKALHTDNWQTVLDDKSVEAVLISTPTFTHEQYARSALHANKHVLCEKPLAAKIEDVDAIVKLAQSKNLKLICAFNRRYDPTFRKVAEQIQRGDIGDVRIIKTCCRDSPLPPIDYIRVSGGIYHDCCVHDIDVCLWYANELPIEVHAYVHTYMEDYKELDDFDTTVVCMKFKSGILSVTDLSRVGPSGYEQRAEVFGPKGVLKIDEFTRSGWEKHTEIGVTRPSQCYSFASRFQDAYQIEINELFNHIEGNKTLHPIMPGYLQALCKVVDAIEHSARSGQPVKLEWTPEEIKNAMPERS